MRSASSKLLIALLFSVAGSLYAQAPAAHVLVPPSSVPAASTSPRAAHTALRIMVQVAAFQKALLRKPRVRRRLLGICYETPASIACVYKLLPHTGEACNPNVVTANPQGGVGAIAIVDAFDDPNAASDLAAFSAQFGLAPANFTVVYAGGLEPPTDPSGGWEVEESLDIEWSHAMAPNAKIYLVEANSNSFDDLITAVTVANTIVAEPAAARFQ